MCAAGFSGLDSGQWRHRWALGGHVLCLFRHNIAFAFVLTEMRVINFRGVLGIVLLLLLLGWLVGSFRMRSVP